MCFDILMLFGVALIPYKYVIPNWDRISNFSPAFYQLSTALSLSLSLGALTISPRCIRSQSFV